MGVVATAVTVIVLCGPASGQDKSAQAPVKPSAAYDVHREGTLVGTVISYTKSSTTPPLGAHVTLQTSAGVVDVHVGDARLLEAHHFPIQQGDTLRIIGETVAYGAETQFVARVVQNGTQALEVRSVRGLPLSYVVPRNSTGSKTQGEVR
jgi:hypothetical protein